VRRRTACWTTTARPCQRRPTQHGLHGSSTAWGAGTGDRSNPDEDINGDACDTDDDNDEINDVSEAGVTIAVWTGFAGAQTTVCEGPGVGALSDYVDPDGVANGGDFTGHLDPKKGDVDQDYFLDGRECSLRSRPDQSIRGSGVGVGFALNCSVTPAPPLDEGCAQGRERHCRAVATQVLTACTRLRPHRPRRTKRSSGRGR
jgi:hypothetical protein